MNRREKAATDTRRALQISARKLFARRGYSDVGIEEIAAGANATTGALYHHFGDKRRLFQAVAEQIEAEIVERVRRNLTAEAGTWEALHSAVSTTLEFASKDNIGRIIFRDAPSVLGGPEWREIELRHGLGGMLAILRSIQSRGELVVNDPDLLAHMLLGALIQAADAVASKPTRSTLKDAGRAMFQVMAAFDARAL